MIPDREMVKFWFDEFDEKLMKLIEDEINDVDGDIKNEHLWELGYEGDEPVNPHTQNIANKELYKTVLKYMQNHMKAYRPFSNEQN